MPKTPEVLVAAPLTFERICELEPEILEIYTAAQTIKTRESATQLWRSNFQPRLGTLVGVHAKKALLRSYEVFAVTVDKVRSVLRQ